jgi:hypothetical protein
VVSECTAAACTVWFRVCVCSLLGRLWRTTAYSSLTQKLVDLSDLVLLCGARRETSPGGGVVSGFGVVSRVF